MDPKQLEEVSSNGIDVALALAEPFTGGEGAAFQPAPTPNAAMIAIATTGAPKAAGLVLTQAATPGGGVLRSRGMLAQPGRKARAACERGDQEDQS